MDIAQTDFLFSLTRAYHLLGAQSDRLHAAHGFTTGTRSVLLLLHVRGAMTLSEIARDRAVSRQFIQRIAMPLVERGLIELLANPANRRSPKLTLTARGREAITAIVEREADLARRIAAALPAEALAAVSRALDQLNAALREHDRG